MDAEIRSYEWDTAVPGPTLVLMGGVHGNEACGPAALHRLIFYERAGSIPLVKGRVIIVPVANPEAFKQNKREVDRNLNRGMRHMRPRSGAPYEDFLCDAICTVLDQADYLLDIHSYTAQGGPFIFMGCRDAEEKAFAEALGVTNNFVWDWENAFHDSGIRREESQSTTGHVRNVDEKPRRALTLECGQHKNLNNADVGFAAALRAMAHLGIIAPETVARNVSGLSLPPVEGEKHFARMKTVVRKRAGVAGLARVFNHFGAIKKGEALAVDKDGAPLVFADRDGLAILPNPGAKEGAETLYLATDEEPFPPAARKKAYCK